MASPWSYYVDESVAEADETVDQTDWLQSIVITPMSPASAARFWYADEPSMSNVAAQTEPDMESSEVECDKSLGSLLEKSASQVLTAENEVTS